MDKVAIIVAGGSGKRMQTDLPKQFLLVNGRPVLYYTLQTFLRAYDDMKIVLVVGEDYISMAEEIIDAYFDRERIQIVMGGATRFESVKNGISYIADDAVVFVHDAVRCMVSEELIHRCYNAALQSGTAIPVVKCSDSVRLQGDDGSEMLDREKILLVQTPQVFHSKILIPAFNIDYKDKFTDEASVVEAFGIKISLVEGEKNNIKITYPIDFAIAEKMLPATF